MIDRLLWLPYALLLVLVTWSSTSLAQTDKAAAEALFREGMRLSKAGSYAEACPKLEESQRHEASLGTQFYLADCFEKIGKTASAWANFAEVANKARLAGETAKEQAARKRADELEPKLAKLSVDVENRALPGLQVQRGAIGIGSGQWGVPVPLDPGAYELKASAPGYLDFSKSVEVKAGATVSEKIPALTPAPASAAPVAAAPVAAPPPASSPPPPEPKASSSTQRTVGLVVGAAGIVTLATSGVLGLMAKSANSTSKEDGYCLPNDTCSTQGLDERDRALKLADAATVVSIVGAVVTATGVVLWLTAPSSHAEAPASARLGVGPGSLVLGGQF